MTYWYTAICQKCRCQSPTLFLEMPGKITLYAIGDRELAAASAWISEHAFHGVTILHEDMDLPADVTPCDREQFRDDT